MRVIYPYDFNLNSFINMFSSLGVRAEFMLANERNIYSADLFLLMGGADICPSLYGKGNYNSSTNVERDYIELFYLISALKLDVKILGVCRGHQLINAVLGGKLHQELTAPHERTHPIKKGENILYEVNSLHHQEVFIPGKDLNILGEYKGAIEITGNSRILSTQFHPEMSGVDKEFYNILYDFLLT